jgi:hypothetical protein
MRRTLTAVVAIALVALPTSPRAAGPGTRSAAPPRALKAPPEVTSESEEGFHDLLLYIERHDRLPGGEQALRAFGTHRGRRVGLEVVLGSPWKAGTLGKDVPLVTYQGTVTYRSIGRESDALLQVLDELFGTKVRPRVMAKSTTFTGITLGGDPRDVRKGPIQVKLFHEGASEADYAELFTNVDIAAGRLEIREKDEEYRSAIVRALAWR